MPSVASLRAITRSSIDIVVPPYVAVEGSSTRTSNAQAVAIEGLVRLRLSEPTTFKQIVVEFSGSLMVMPVPVGRSWRPDSRIVSMLSHTALDRKTTLCAGTHEFPFSMTLPPDLPCSLPDIGGMARVTYTLRARAVRLGLWPNLACERRVHLVRSYPRESIEFQNVYEAENTWRGKAIYSIALPHRAWAAGDTLMALVKLVPLCKEAIPTELRLSIREDVRIVTTNGPRSFTRHVATITHPVRFAPQAHEQEPSTSTIRPPHPDDWVRPSDPGPFSLLIPPRTLPTYRTALVSVRHHLDILVRFAATSPSSTPGASPSTSTSSSTSSTSSQVYSSESCSVSLGVRILSNQLISVARQATLSNREALFGVLPELMAMRDASNGDVDINEDGDLPSYANHVQDTIPFTPLLEDIDASRRSSFDTTRSLDTNRSLDTTRSIDSLSFDLRMLSRVPDYGAAIGSSRAGVVPLWSTQGLPSYAEVALQQATMSMQFVR